MIDALYTDDVCWRYERRSSRGAKETQFVRYGRQWLGCSLCCDVPGERSRTVDHWCSTTSRCRCNGCCGNWDAKKRKRKWLVELLLMSRNELIYIISVCYFHYSMSLSTRFLILFPARSYRLQPFSTPLNPFLEIFLRSHFPR